MSLDAFVTAIGPTFDLEVFEIEGEKETGPVRKRLRVSLAAIASLGADLHLKMHARFPANMSDAVLAIVGAAGKAGDRLAAGGSISDATKPMFSSKISAARKTVQKYRGEACG